jgi:predicted CopG family antitoxin
MRKKITLSIDEDVYDSLQEIPKGVSLSDVATFAYKLFLEEFKKGRELTDKEVDDLFNRTPEDLALRLRIKKYIKPTTMKMEKAMDKVEKKLTGSLKAPFKRKYRRQK